MMTSVFVLSVNDRSSFMKCLVPTHQRSEWHSPIKNIVKLLTAYHFIYNSLALCPCFYNFQIRSYFVSLSYAMVNQQLYIHKPVKPPLVL